MKWCHNDYHSQPMWCGRRNGMNKADFAQHMQNKRNKGTNGDHKDGGKNTKAVKVHEEFKMALAALTTPEDYAILDEQFFQVKD